MTDAIERVALDAESKRTYDDNGFLHVSISPLTRVQVAPPWERDPRLAVARA